MKDRLDAEKASAAAMTAAFSNPRTIDLAVGELSRDAPWVAGIGVALDIVTTDDLLGREIVVRLAASRFAYGHDHAVLQVEDHRAWHRDPGVPLAAGVVAATGMTDAIVRGHSIDIDEATRVIGAADIRVAHGASYVRPAIETLLPGVGGLPWACTSRDVDWSPWGSRPPTPEQALAYVGGRRDASAGDARLDIMVEILRGDIEPGRSVLSALIEGAGRISWVALVRGTAPTELKHRLHGRGYRWDPLRHAWMREVTDRDEEERWLIEAGRGPGGRGTCVASIDRVDWSNRHA